MKVIVLFDDGRYVQYENVTGVRDGINSWIDVEGCGPKGLDGPIGPCGGPPGGIDDDSNLNALEGESRPHGVS